MEELKLSERLRNYRLRNGLPIRKLAAKIGVSHTTISNVERGMEPHQLVRFKIEKFLKSKDKMEAA
jgi:transcriptional regulator with XRE-family HTH domain